MHRTLEELVSRIGALAPCADDIETAGRLIVATFRSGGKVLACGNGGSAADAEHIVGELMKRFRRARPLPGALASRMRPELAARLEGALPAVSLVSMSGLVTAFANDVAWETAFAQQVVGLATRRDILIALSTSGNSANCVAAAEAMRAVGGKVIALTGAAPSRLSAVADVAVRVPETETARVQELHLPVYHALCAMAEEEMFGDGGLLVGLDIGGTKCAISTGRRDGAALKILSRDEFPTAGLTPGEVLEAFAARIAAIGADAVEAIGVSCGGPLDSRRGIVLSPPNLPGWDEVKVTDFFESRFGIATHLANDANACALAEYLYGSGRGTRNLVFMTFGTGLGAGLVIDGRLYSGTTGDAGEIGHIRLAPEGPVGYNKAGSAEGFCSGAGIARLAKMRKGLDLTAKELFARVRAGDSAAREVFEESARHLATILAYTIDIVNPEVIALGGVFMRNADLFMPVVEPLVEREALPAARRACRIVAAELGENIGDWAALAVAAAAKEA